MQTSEIKKATDLLNDSYFYIWPLVYCAPSAPFTSI